VDPKPCGHRKQTEAAAYNRLIEPSVDILILCTGNICRSPMAEGLLRERLRERGIDASVSSAGLSFDDRPATDDAIEAAAGYGLDLRDHRSRMLFPEFVERADLVLAMERLHAREAIVLADDALARTFTLKELVRRARAAGHRRADESFDDWLARVSAERKAMDLMGESRDDDVADPYLSSPKVYSACIAELDELVRELVNLAWPRAAEGAA
jgi:protein-tyrosine phosphatase